MRRPLTLLSVALAAASALAQDQVAWRRPPEPIQSLVTAEPTPSVSLSPCRRYLLFTHVEGMPGLDVVARPHLKLAGQRIDPDVRGPQLGTKTTRLVLRTLADGSEREIRVPSGHLGGALWSADGGRLAITRATLQGIELWLADPLSGEARSVPGVRVNAVLGGGVAWLPDQGTLLVRLVVPGAPPPRPAAPAGPAVQETSGKRAQVRTFQDLLQNDHDAQLFEFYGTSQLAIVPVEEGKVTPIGDPGLYASVDPSPDGQYLLVSRVERPFSLLVPWRDFPRRVELWDRTGQKLRELALQPLQETVPIGGVPTGPRGFDWVPVRPHALTWVEALDGGDPKAKVPVRDVVKLLTEPTGEASEWLRTQHRFQGARYGEDGALALVSETDRDTRRQRLWRFDAKDPAKPGVQLYERSMQDAYGDPGNPVTRLSPHGQSLLRMHGSVLFRSGQGASAQGDRPFLDAWDLAAEPGTPSKRVWQCAEGRLESFVGFLDDAGQRLLIASESPSEPRNYHALDLTSGSRKALTAFTDPALPYIQKIKREILRYQRKDGVALSGTLCLPPDWQEGQRLPVLVWAYPVEFNQADDAAQVRGSPHRYVRLSGTSHLWLLLAGYAVLDDASMPVVGPVRTANDTFVEQIVMNAEAAAKALVAHGVGDPERLAVAGHSYGAFMTANLLCHTDVFAAGIARSGAYNRTLTPFGFQREERTYWEAPQIYQTMSPFANAHRLNEPLLLVHGDDDNNPGTFPIQSQRLYHAIKGHGGTARLVMLPHESHGYRARESTLHCLAEMIDWLDRWVKNRPSR